MAAVSRTEEEFEGVIRETHSVTLANPALFRIFQFFRLDKHVEVYKPTPLTRGANLPRLMGQLHFRGRGSELSFFVRPLGHGFCDGLADCLGGSLHWIQI
jgi:hypothetical protein